MKVSKAKLLALFIALGFKTAKKWDLAKFKERLAKLPELINKDTVVDDKELKNLLKAIMTAAKEEKEVEIVDGDEKPSKKKKAEAAEDEDDEEEEDGDDAEDEDDEEEEDDTEDDEEEDEDSEDEDDEDAEDEEEDEKPKKKKKTAAAEGDGEKKKRGAVKSAGGAGVIGTIVACLKEASKKNPVSKKDIVAKLKKAFPDRDEKGMGNTVTIQLGGRLKNEKQLDIVKVGEGKDVAYYVKA